MNVNSEKGSRRTDVIEREKDEIRETAASVPAEMEAAVGRKKTENVTVTSPGDDIIPTTYPTIIPPIAPIGPGFPYVAYIGGSGTEVDSKNSAVSVRSSVDDLVEAHDRNN